jgi:hypothetical protein
MTPTPVNLNELPFLKNARKVMQKVESTSPKVLSEQTREQTEREDLSESYSQEPVRSYSDTVQKSGLPESIKKLMLDKPINPEAAGFKLNINDTYNEADEREMPLPQPKLKTKQGLIRESAPLQRNSDLITVSRAELDAMINEKLLDLLAKSYNKTLTEETIKRTIKSLISEGKLSVKKKA